MENNNEIKAIINELLNSEDNVTASMAKVIEETPSLLDLLKDHIDIDEFLEFEDKEEAIKALLDAFDHEDELQEKMAVALEETPSLLDIIIDKVNKFREED